MGDIDLDTIDLGRLNLLDHPIKEPACQQPHQTKWCGNQNTVPCNTALFDSALFDSALFGSALFDSALFDTALLITLYLTVLYLTVLYFSDSALRKSNKQSNVGQSSTKHILAWDRAALNDASGRLRGDWTGRIVNLEALSATNKLISRDRNSIVSYLVFVCKNVKFGCWYIHVIEQATLCAQEWQLLMNKHTSNIT